jgi:hypothetical protein
MLEDAFDRGAIARLFGMPQVHAQERFHVRHLGVDRDQVVKEILGGEGLLV